jgi:hypothetical protein
MANSDKNIVITPNIGSTTAQPNIVFTGQNASPITLRVTDDGALSWEGSAGQLFSISNNLTGVLFSINDISGLPILEITDTPSIIAYAPITGAGGATQLTNISNLCDNDRCVFDLKQDQTILGSTYIVDSKDLEVIVNGQQLNAYITEQPGPWTPAYDNGGSYGFRVRENRLIIYNAPDIGSRVTITMRKTAATRQRRRYPFAPTTVVLGD